MLNNAACRPNKSFQNEEPFLQTKTKAHLAVLSANLIFGVNFSVVKLITPELIKPFGLNVVRVLVTTGLFWMMSVGEKRANPIERKDLRLFLLCGITGVTINQLLFIKGLSMTYSTHGALLMLCTPLLITFMAFAFLKEKLSLLRILGLVLGVSGAVMLIAGGSRSGEGSNVVLGDMLIVVNAISYSFYFILVKPLILKYAPLQVIRWVFTMGTLFILPFGWEEFMEAPWDSFTRMDFAAIAFVVLGATFLAYLFNIYGLRHLQASGTGAYIYLQPIFASIVAAVFLQEGMGWHKLLAAFCIFAGVFLVNRKH
jgi:drug/metabolite transporter (DMT)-like permease